MSRNYHLSWLEVAINNFKNNKTEVKVINEDMTIGEFIDNYAKEELKEVIQLNKEVYDG